MMKAVMCNQIGGIGTLYIKQVAKPILCETRNVLIRVVAAGINRADILQRQGKYPPPPGESEIIGLEVSGYICETLGKTNFKVGDKIMALLSGGGYAEYVSVPESHCMSVPPVLNLYQAASVPEAWITAYQLLTRILRIDVSEKPELKESILIHAAGSNVGMAAIQLSRKMGLNTIIATSRTQEKLEVCEKIGATHTIVSKKDENFSSEVLRITNGRGADYILDCVGGSYAEYNLDSCANEGEWVIYGLLGGPLIQNFNLGKILRKHITIKSTTLRSRSNAYKSELVKDFNSDIISMFSSGEANVHLEKVYNLEEVNLAHKHVEENKSNGKIVLKIGQEI